MIPTHMHNTGYLPPGYHQATLDEFEQRFVHDFPSSNTRPEIIEEYKTHCNDIVSTNLAERQWINGSFVTTKIDPEEIDLLTEIDGVDMDLLDFKEEMDRIIYDAPLRTNLRCHSFYVARYPEEIRDKYETYIAAKVKYLGVCWNSDDEYNLKGIIEMDLDSI